MIFAQGNVTAVVVKNGKAHYEVRNGDTVVHTQPATRAWQQERKQVIAIAEQEVARSATPKFEVPCPCCGTPVSTTAAGHAKRYGKCYH
jgi:hypothetical protein